MLFATFIPAIIIVVLIYFFVIWFFRWRWLSYGLSLSIATALISFGAVHTILIAIEVAGLGFLITWLDPMSYWRSNATPPSSSIGAASRRTYLVEIPLITSSHASFKRSTVENWLKTNVAHHWIYIGDGRDISSPSIIFEFIDENDANHTKLRWT